MATELITRTDLSTGVVVEETYLRDRRKHRDPAAGPAYIRRNRKTGAVIEIEYRVDGVWHRTDGPAYTRRDRHGLVIEERYRVHGKAHREDGPATFYISRGNVHLLYEQHGKHFRAVGPSQIVMSGDTGLVRSEYYCGLPGKLHREDGPAQIGRSGDAGKVSSEGYFLFGKRHRDPRLGPADVEYHRDGHVSRAEYRVNGKLHRENGPASYSRVKDVIYESWARAGAEFLRRERDARTNRPINQRYLVRVDGQQFIGRPVAEGPALIEYDPDTGAIAHEKYIDERGDLRQENFYKDGKLHRPVAEGPALIEHQPHWPQPVYAQYWQDGVRVTWQGMRFEP